MHGLWVSLERLLCDLQPRRLVLGMSPRLRKLALTAHVTASVGWLGAVAAYLALAVTGLSTSDEQLARAAYRSLEIIGRLVIVPSSLAALLTGLVQSLGTEWGFFRHYWIAAKFALTVVGTAILLGHMRAVSRMAEIAAQSSVFDGEFGMLRTQLVVHAAGGLLLLLAVVILSVYKPWGRTPYGKRLRSRAENAATRQV